LGEDIADAEDGGVVGATKGLSSKFGTARVRTTPISEQAIIGAAIGASIVGMRPVAEIMLMNFTTVAMLAGGGELDGVRILSSELVKTLYQPRSHSDEKDAVMFNISLPISLGGFWLGGDYPPVCSAKFPRAICHPGQGGSIGWADPHDDLAVAICHNRLFNAASIEEDALLTIATAVRDALGLAG